RQARDTDASRRGAGRLFRDEMAGDLVSWCELAEQRLLLARALRRIGLGRAARPEAAPRPRRERARRLAGEGHPAMVPLYGRSGPAGGAWAREPRGTNAQPSGSPRRVGMRPGMYGQLPPQEARPEEPRRRARGLIGATTQIGAVTSTIPWIRL